VLCSVKRVKKNGGIEAIKDRIKTPGTVDIGVIDAGKHSSGDLTVAQIAFINEFGVGVPERSFMRTTIAKERSKIKAKKKKYLSLITKGEMKTNKALALLGEYLADKIRLKIIKIKSPPNSPRTIALKKGKANPLIDTGQMKNSITYKVNR